MIVKGITKGQQELNRENRENILTALCFLFPPVLFLLVL